jgi:hypothetical protein
VGAAVCARGLHAELAGAGWAVAQFSGDHAVSHSNVGRPPALLMSGVRSGTSITRRAVAALRQSARGGATKAETTRSALRLRATPRVQAVLGDRCMSPSARCGRGRGRWCAGSASCRSTVRIIGRAARFYRRTMVKLVVLVVERLRASSVAVTSRRYGPGFSARSPTRPVNVVLAAPAGRRGMRIVPTVAVREQRRTDLPYGRRVTHCLPDR